MIDEFIKYLTYQKKYSCNTITNYSLDLHRFYNYLQTNKINYKKITYNEVSDYIDYLHTIKLSPSTILRNTSSLRTYYNYLLKNDYVKSNPLNLVTNIKREQKLPNYLQYNELEDILKLCSNDSLGIRNRTIIELLVASGLRVSELIGIKLEDLDLNEKSIKVLGKGNKMRIVYYGDYAQESLNNYLNSSRNTLLGKKYSDYLFINHLGDRLTRRGVEDIITKLAEKSLIDHQISPHVFRHTFATMMINEGANIKVVQELLGHSNLETTSIYTHISNDKLRKAYLDCHPRAKK